jgi:hypothetical protein
MRVSCVYRLRHFYHLIPLMTAPIPSNSAARDALDAFVNGDHPAFAPIAAQISAVAIRSAVDRILPQENRLSSNFHVGYHYRQSQRCDTRTQFLALADAIERDGLNNSRQALYDAADAMLREERADG